MDLSWDNRDNLMDIQQERTYLQIASVLFKDIVYDYTLTTKMLLK
jgi:hypothetical protein